MLDDEAPVVISSQTLNRQDGRDEYHVRSKAAWGPASTRGKAEGFEARVLEPQSHSAVDRRIILGYRCANSRMTLAVGVDHTIATDNAYSEHISADDDTGKMVYRVAAKPGQPLKITKTVAYHTSRGVPVRELVDRCQRTLDRTRDRGIEAELIAQRQWLDAFWERSDVVVHGQPSLQQAVRWNLFQVAQATARAEQSGVPAKGVTGSGYGGHYFWDTEIYVLPFLTYTSPQMARSALRFRYNMLDAAAPARRGSRPERCSVPVADGQRRGGFRLLRRGHRAVPHRRRHRYALCKYVAASGDQEFMNREGVDILVETARMWADLGFWRENGGGGTYLPHPRRHRAGRVHHGGQRQPVHQRDGAVQPRPGRRGTAAIWSATSRRRYHGWPSDSSSLPPRSTSGPTCADAMDIPYDERHRHQPPGLALPGPGGLGPEEHPAGEAAAAAALSPAGDLPLPGAQAGGRRAGALPPGRPFHARAEARRLRVLRPDHHRRLHALRVSCSRSSRRRWAIAILLCATSTARCSSTWPTCTATPPTACTSPRRAGSGTPWPTGSAGCATTTGSITFDPRLPETWERLTFQITLHGSRIRVDLSAGEIAFTVVEGTSAELSVRGHHIRVSAASTVRVPLSDQGPRSPVRCGRRPPTAGRTAP